MMAWREVEDEEGKRRRTRMGKEAETQMKADTNL